MITNRSVARVNDGAILIIAYTSYKPVLFVTLIALALYVAVLTTRNVGATGLTVTIGMRQIVVVFVVSLLAVRALF